MSTMYNLLHIPLCTVMLILIFNSTAYCHAHSFTFYILFFISYFSFILSYVYFPCVVFSIFALSMERTRLSFHCWLYSLCIVVYVTNKTWNLKLELETCRGEEKDKGIDLNTHPNSPAACTLIFYIYESQAVNVEPELISFNNLSGGGSNAHRSWGLDLCARWSVLRKLVKTSGEPFKSCTRQLYGSKAQFECFGKINYE